MDNGFSERHNEPWAEIAQERIDNYREDGTDGVSINSNIINKANKLF